MLRNAKQYTIPSMFIGAFFALSLPLHVHAEGLFVPVVDDTVRDSVDYAGGRLDTLNEAFNSYATDFKNYVYEDDNRSLRALLSLNPETGESSQLYLPGKHNPTTGGKAEDPVDRTDKDTIAATKNNACELRPITNNAKAAAIDEKSAWMRLYQQGYIDKQYTDFSATQVNNSTSLSCLLQEMVEQNKLALNLKIHSLLRDYIATAQVTQLAQRASGMIAKANIDWAKTGNKTTITDGDGNVISQESYSVLGNDPNAYTNSLTQARTRTLQNRILASNDSPDSLQICGSDKYAVARQLLISAHTQTSDPLDTLSSQVSCSLTNKTNPGAGLFATEDGYNQFISPGGGGSQQDSLETLQQLVLNDQNTGPGLAFALDNAQTAQIGQIQTDATNQYIAGGGILPARQCDPSDPNCDPRYSEISTPGRIVGDVISGYVRSPDERLAAAKTPEDLSAVDTSVNNSPSETILRNGLDNTDANALIPKQNPAKYVSDFLNSIEGGYFDLQAGTTDWAAGAMLKIYDNVMTDPSVYMNKNTLDPADTMGDVSSSTATTP